MPDRLTVSVRYGVKSYTVCVGFEHGVLMYEADGFPDHDTAKTAGEAWLELVRTALVARDKEMQCEAVDRSMGPHVPLQCQLKGGHTGKHWMSWRPGTSMEWEGA